MKQLFFLVLLTISSLTTASAQSGKVAHVNFGNLLNELPEVTAADEQLEGLSNKMTIQGQEMVSKLKADFAAAEAQVRDLKPAELATIQKKLEADQQAIQKFQQKIQVDVETLRRKLLGPIIDRAKAAIKKIADAKGFDIVIDSSIFNAVLFVEEGYDLTDEVKAELLK